MISEQPDLLKIALAGTHKVGKSKLIERFTSDTFVDPLPCVLGIEFVRFPQKIVKIRLGSLECKLQVWDNALAEGYSTVLAAYYRKVHGVMLVYSVTERSSFSKIQTWADTVMQAAPNAAMLLVGSKADLRSDREVSYCEGVQLAESLGVPFLEASARTATNVDSAFALLTRLAVEECSLSTSRNS